MVVNNSGINMLSPLHEMPTDTWRHVLDVSLTGPFMVTRRALNVMRDRGTPGAIVNMSSIAAWMRTAEGESHYAAAKAGITGFTRAAAMEAAPHGVRVNAVAPGLAWNPFLGKIYGDDYVEEMARQTPLGRVGQPQDIANAVAFLAWLLPARLSPRPGARAARAPGRDHVRPDSSRAVDEDEPGTTPLKFS